MRNFFLFVLGMLVLLIVSYTLLYRYAIKSELWRGLKEFKNTNTRLYDSIE